MHVKWIPILAVLLGGELNSVLLRRWSTPRPAEAARTAGSTAGSA